MQGTGMNLMKLCGNDKPDIFFLVGCQRNKYMVKVGAVALLAGHLPSQEGGSRPVRCSVGTALP